MKYTQILCLPIIYYQGKNKHVPVSSSSFVDSTTFLGKLLKNSNGRYLAGINLNIIMH